MVKLQVKGGLGEGVFDVAPFLLEKRGDSGTGGSRWGFGLGWDATGTRDLRWGFY